VTLRFQADADFNEKIVAAALRLEPSLDFRTADDAGLRGLSDPDVLALAAAGGRLLVSHDLRTMPRHFGQFVSTARSPGVVIVPQHMPIAVAVEELLLIWSASEAAEWIDRLYVVPS
jgi:hypothetical protein